MYGVTEYSVNDTSIVTIRHISPPVAAQTSLMPFSPQTMHVLHINMLHQKLMLLADVQHDVMVMKIHAQLGITCSAENLQHALQHPLVSKRCSSV